MRIFRELEKSSRGDWIDNLGAISVIVFGFIFIFVCWIAMMIGDYDGLPEGIAAQSTRFQYFPIVALPGIVFVIVGIRRLIRVNFPRK
jgi:hypothetical protein